MVVGNLLTLKMKGDVSDFLVWEGLVKPVPLLGLFHPLCHKNCSVVCDLWLSNAAFVTVEY